MRLLITGACGFVGSELCLALQEHLPAAQITGVDNFCRRGSWRNLPRLEQRGIKVLHVDIRQASDLEGHGPYDWVIDAAANPSVLAGVDGKASSRQLVEHNLLGTVQMLEACKRWGAGFVLLSTSRVYSIPPLAGLEVEVRDQAFSPTAEALATTAGLTAQGISESFSTAAPVSLYGATKLASEALALEYGEAFGLPVWVNRCGVLAGAGQFGKADQGIFAFWLHSWREQRPLRYIGFDGQGHQVRDCLHPRDLAALLVLQLQAGEARDKPRLANVSGCAASVCSLAQLSAWCSDRWGAQAVAHDPVPRPY
ncbi:MAG: NAD-dependent epimerase/dehydratase family protein, partial [Pirellulales bacterium]